MRFDIISALSSRGKRLISRKTLIICAVVAALLCAYAAGGIYGKYTHQSTGDGLVTAKEFYFESDVLAEESGGTYPSYDLAPGTNSITFQLQNFADALRFAGHNIAFEIDVATSGAAPAVTINGESATEGTITAASENGVSVPVTISGLETGQTYTVTATTVGGYYKVLKASFTVGGAPTGIYTYLDTAADSHYVELIIWSENAAGTVTFTAPSGLIPDISHGAILNSVVFSAENGNINGSCKFRYFRETPDAPFVVNGGGANSFTVTMGGSPVPVKKP